MPLRRFITPSAENAPDAEPPSDPQDIEWLFREHNDALLRFVAARLGSRQEAREIAQEAYVRVLSLDRREAVSYLRAFLFKTAANLAMDRLRQRARRGGGKLADASAEPVFELSPERSLAGEQALQSLGSAIDELPEKCREVFLLYRLEELSATSTG